MTVFKRSFCDRNAGEAQQASKWQMRFRDHHGRTLGLVGFSDRRRTIELGRTIDVLVTSRIGGDPPSPALLGSLHELPERITQRLVEFGLLDERQVTASAQV